jgi:predicted PurR-regulated permease PerM
VAKTASVPQWQRALIALSATMIGVVIVGALYWAQIVFIPLALAVFLAFLLNPAVRALQRRGLDRVPSVIAVVALAALVLTSIGALAARQVSALVADLPNYTANIKGRMESIRELSGGEFGERLEKMIAEVNGDQKANQVGAKDETSGKRPILDESALDKPQSVVVRPESPIWIGRLPMYLSSTAEVAGGLALALVLAVFMLLKREVLRSRFLGLVGHGRISSTTKAVDDAGQRISRYLLMQLLINASFGLVLAVALFVIGLQNAVLWGLLTALLRYVPYIGAWIATALLFVLSLAMFPGWLQPLLVLGCMLGLELITSNLVEPLLFGKSLGVSEVALLMAAAFWAFLWGPIGLVLSGPLTVCLLVLGKYVPQLQFLDALLGDEPLLDPKVNFYQRLLARDQDEATALVLCEAKAIPAERLYDDLLVPALNYLKRDRERDELTEADEHFLLRATSEIAEDLGVRQLAQTAALESATPGGGSLAALPQKARLLGCPGHDEADVLALQMLQQLLDAAKWDVEILSLDLLSAELIALIGDKKPPVVCIAALPPGGLAHTRYLCKRLRARLPQAKILVGRWGLAGNLEQNEDQLREAGADQVETTLLQTRDHLQSWLPVLVKESPRGSEPENPSKPRLVAV